MVRELSGRRSLVLVLVVVAGGCSGTPTRSSGSTGPEAVPNPFTVVASYSASSLGLLKPANLAIGPDGNLYVTDATQHVTVISPDGDVVMRWGHPGSAAGQFSFVSHDFGVRGVTAPIAVGTDGRVYVADSGNARVEVFSSDGDFIREFGGRGTREGRFQFPSFIAVDRNGDVYVADDQSESITKFSSSGALEWRIGGASSDELDLIGHFHLATVDAHDRLVALNDDQKETLYIDERGRVVDRFGSGGCDVTVDGAGDTYVNDCQEPLTPGHDTWVFDRNHRLVGEWDESGFGWSPRFGPNGEVFTLGEDGSVLRLEVALPDA